MSEQWISERARNVDASGIRKVFDLASRLEHPIDLSIGQPDLDVPEAAKLACIDAIRSGKNGYTVTQGIGPLREKLLRQVAAEYPDQERDLIITSGTTGGLVLAILTLVNPGDEVIIFDPYFVMYRHLVVLAGGVPVFVDTYPSFTIDPDRVRAAITPRTKGIIVNSPANPTGAVMTPEEVEAIARLAAERGLFLLSDEVYRCLVYEKTFSSPARWYDQTVVVDGFSKAYSMTGWRLGYAHGPKEIIQQMAKLQQFTFVCAPQPVQWAGIVALDADIGDRTEIFRRRRDLLLKELSDYYEIPRADGAFYLFPRVPWGTGSTFVAEAISRNLLIIPGNVFSRQDSHFRLSYAASDETLARGIEVLIDLARNPRRSS